MLLLRINSGILTELRSVGPEPSLSAGLEPLIGQYFHTFFVRFENLLSR